MKKRGQLTYVVMGWMLAGQEREFCCASEVLP